MQQSSSAFVWRFTIKSPAHETKLPASTGDRGITGHTKNSFTTDRIFASTAGGVGCEEDDPDELKKEKKKTSRETCSNLKEWNAVRATLRKGTTRRAATPP